MSGSVLDFDEVAADDALIESLRAGATADDLPADDAAVGALLSLRDGVDVADGDSAVRKSVTVPARAVVTGVVLHRRSIAVSAIAGVLATAGVGTAVAGDPTAAFTYLFRQGVEAGHWLGTPEGDAGAMGHAGRVDPPAAVSSVPVRQGSAATRGSADGHSSGPVGFERGSRYWTVPAPRGLESLVGDGGDSAGEGEPHDGLGGFDDDQIGDEATTRVPHESETIDPGTFTPPGEGEDDGGVDADSDTDTDAEESTDPTTSPPTDGGSTTLTETPPVTSEPPPETTTTPPPETTASPPPETTTPPPETVTSPETTPAPTESSPTESEPTPSPSETSTTQ